MPLNWQLWDRIRALTRKANIYRTDNLFQDQDSIDRIIANGNFLDFGKQSALLEQTSLQINRLERYKDYDLMDEVGEVSLALDIYADESSLVDSERKHAIVVRAKDKRVKRIIEDFLYNTILIDREIRPIIRYLCKYGDFPAEIIPTKNRDGVASFRFMNVYNFTRVQTRYGDLVGFFYQDPTSASPVFLYPWQVVHMRLTSYEQIYHPYGRSILDGGRKDFKRLRLMEDAALIYRITRAPEKRIFSIPVGNMPPMQVPAYMAQVARQFKKQKFVDPATGQVNERYSPLIQEDDFFLPKRADGTGPEVDTLPGAENLDAIADIEYFKKKMVAGLKIPFNRLGIGEQSQSDGKSLAATSPEFAKNIQWIQREVALGLKKLVIVHLILRGMKVRDIKNFDLQMTAASAIDELYRVETWNTRANIMANLKDIGYFPPTWILEHFTDMSRDEAEEIQREVAKTSGANVGGLNNPSAPPPMAMPMESVEGRMDRLITEYADQHLGRSIDIPDVDDLNENVQSGNIMYFLNSKELDAMPNAKGETVEVNGKKYETMVDWSVDKDERDAVLNETRTLMSAGSITNPEIAAIAQKVEDTQVISEGELPKSAITED